MSSINAFVGLPFLDKGRGYHGVDCWGLVRLYYRDELGIMLPSYADYNGVEDVENITYLINHYRDDWYPVDEPRRGDVVLIKIAGVATHVGVYHTQGRFLHVQIGKYSELARINSETWRRRIVGYYRYYD